MLDRYLRTRRIMSPVTSWSSEDRAAASAVYSITPTGLRFKANAKLSFNCTGIELEGKGQRSPIIHRLEQGAWTPIPSYVDPQRQEVVAFIVDLGIYQLRYGDRQQPELSPKVHALTDNYPNPFNNSTSIRYEISSPGRVKIEIYNLLGQRVVTLVDEYRPIGRYATEWYGKNEDNQTVSSGIYFYTMKAGDFVQTKRMVFLK